MNMERAQGLLLVLGLLAATCCAFEPPRPDELALEEWLRSKGAIFNATTGWHEGVRGLYATADIEALGVIAAIPLDLVFFIPDSEGLFAETGVHVLKETLNASSPLATWLSTLPPLDDLGPGYESIPPQYLPLLESSIMADYILSMQQAINTVWEAQGWELTRIGATRDMLAHAVQLVTTRTFGVLDKRAMAPLMDMANHHFPCATYDPVEPCPHLPDKTCFLFRSGVEIKAGEEVCFPYGYLTGDETLLQYGFITPTPADGQALPLFKLDRADFTARSIGEERGHEVPTPFNGTAAEIHEEAERLKELLGTMEARNTDAATWPVAEALDPGGRILKVLQQWRLQRQSVIRAEVARLEAALAAADASEGEGATGSEGASCSAV